jgi:hypothetical protein
MPDVFITVFVQMYSVNRQVNIFYNGVCTDVFSKSSSKYILTELCFPFRYEQRVDYI